jgi:hypothetical protein
MACSGTALLLNIGSEVITWGVYKSFAFLFVENNVFGERRWNDIDRGKPKNSKKSLSQCHFVHHKSHMD